MSDRVLLDTDIWSELFRARNRAVNARGYAYLSVHRRYTVCAPSVMEITRGLRKLQHDSRIEAFLRRVAQAIVLPFDAEAAAVAGRINGDLERVGRPIGVVDAMIAGVALSQLLTLVTGSTAHYQRIVDLGYPLRLDNWREPAQES